MIVNSIYDIFVTIGGCEIFDSNTASNMNIVIDEDIATGFPVCQLKFTSSREFLADKPIVDGTLVEIDITCKALNIKENLRFRVSGVKAIGSGTSFTYIIECFLDFYELFRSPNKYAAKGLSSEIFKNVAEQNKVQYLIDQTNDAQLWVPSELNLGSWLNIIANHGWVDLSSCMIWFMNRKKELFYKNIDTLFYESKTKKKFTYGDLDLNDSETNRYKYKVLVFKMETGKENIFNRGYDGRNFHFDLLSYGTKTDNANKVRAITEIVNINKELSQGLEENLLEIDTGNFHDHYFMAEIQNSRIRSSLSTYAIMACEYFYPVRLGEIVYLNPVAAGVESTYIKSLNCKYMISSIKTRITESSANMDIELCTQGFNGQSTESY